MMNQKKLTISIIGGGIAGCSSALELAKTYNVRIIEQYPELMSGSSDSTPCRLGLGFHYIDEATAVRSLTETVKIARKYPEFIFEKRLNHLCHCRYFITKDSLFTPRKILSAYRKLQKKYEELVAYDPKNQVFGHPEQFFRILDPTEYEDYLDSKKVEIGIQTHESLFDWNRYKKSLIDQLANNQNVQIITNETVTKVRNNSGFEIYTDKNCYRSDYIINCAWHNIESINQMYGININNNLRTNRLKVLVEVELPPDLQDKNSAFFCFGPHCAFTNRGSGRGYLTYEPVTNIESSTDISISPRAKRLLKKGSETQKEFDTYSRQIIEGVSSYIPTMIKAKPVAIKFGIVKSKGRVDIFSPSSDFHKRNDTGVTSPQRGWIVNACMKLIYFETNAQHVKKLVEDQENMKTLQK